VQVVFKYFITNILHIVPLKIKVRSEDKSQREGQVKYYKFTHFYHCMMYCIPPYCPIINNTNVIERL